MAVKVGIMCPTRSRPDEARTLCRSVLETSQTAIVGLYVDNDQKTTYKRVLQADGLWGNDRIKVHFGDPIGPVAAANHLARELNVALYGFVPDDCRILTPGWDEYALELAWSLPRRIGVISPAHNFGDHIDIPFVTREWLEVTEEFGPNPFWHWCWPTAIGLLSEIAKVAIRADKDRFYIHHDHLPSHNQDHWKSDSEAFYLWLKDDFYRLLYRLRKALGEVA